MCLDRSELKTLLEALPSGSHLLFVDEHHGGGYVVIYAPVNIAEYVLYNGVGDAKTAEDTVYISAAVVGIRGLLPSKGECSACGATPGLNHTTCSVCEGFVDAGIYLANQKAAKK